MQLGFTPDEERFRELAAKWLEQALGGPFRDVRGISSHTAKFDRRRAWERELGAAKWSCVGWPAEFGGRNATLAEQVLFAEEYARCRAPARLGHLGVELVGPTLLALGSEEQRRRFLPPIARGEEIWCQGYSEPNAGSDLANVRTTARLEAHPGGCRWVLEGQKTWTSLAQIADWIFVLCRTDPSTRGHEGLSYLLVPMRQAGIEVRPIREMTGETEFNEVFFSGAGTDASNVVGEPGGGWKIAMATLAFERGVSTLAQQMNFRNELDAVIAAAKGNGAASDPAIRQRIAEAHVGLTIMRFSALRMLSNAERGLLRGEAYTYRLHWGVWRKKLGELAMDVLGPSGEIARHDRYEWDDLPHMFLFSRADTIYGGTSQIQRNIIAERVLGLPKEPRAAPQQAGIRE
jgi:alkylation response protein AidB-like acyl-CoA dehydrogenase